MKAFRSAVFVLGLFAAMCSQAQVVQGTFNGHITQTEDAAILPMGALVNGSFWYDLATPSELNVVNELGERRYYSGPWLSISFNGVTLTSTSNRILVHDNFYSGFDSFGVAAHGDDVKTTGSAEKWDLALFGLNDLSGKALGNAELPTSLSLANFRDDSNVWLGYSNDTRSFFFVAALDSLQASIPAVPEPSALVLMIGGVAFVMAIGRKRYV